MTGAPVTRAGWQCPGCGTYYSPDMPSCSCESANRSLADRIVLDRVIVFPGSAARGITAPCTCPQSWHATVPPPPCPVHGQTQMLQVTCR